MKRPSTYSLLAPYIAAIDCTVYVSSITDNMNFNYTINCCSTLWASLGFPITIAGQTYTITSFVPDVSLTVQGTVALSLNTTSFTLYAPKFYHGTIKATDTDLNEQVNNNLLTSDKLPMIWLHEPTNEVIDEDPITAIHMRSQCELYAMINDQAAWTNDNYYEFAIYPMRNLIDALMASISKGKNLNRFLIKKSTPKDLPRLTSYTGKTPGNSTMFSQPMSGSRFDLEIPWIGQDLLTHCGPQIARP